MDNDNLLIICRSCGRKTLMHNMRPDSDGENMICVDCLKKKSTVKAATGIFGKADVENTPFTSPTEKRVHKTEQKEKMVKYLCTNCKYKFSRKESQAVEKCPYCGKSTIILDNALGAEKLIKDSTDKRFETW